MSRLASPFNRTALGLLPLLFTVPAMAQATGQGGSAPASTLPPGPRVSVTFVTQPGPQPIPLTRAWQQHLLLL